MSIDAIKKALGDDYIVDTLGTTGSIFVVVPKAAAPATKAKAKAVAEDEPDTDEDEGVTEDAVVAAERTRLEGLGIRALKAEAKEAGFDPADIKAATKDDLVDALVEHFASDDEEEDEDAEDDAADEDSTEDEDDEDTEPGEEDEDDAESDLFTEAALNDMSLAEVKGILTEGGWEKADLKGKTKEELVQEYGDYFGFASDDTADDSDDAETEDEDDEEELDEDALRAMSLKDLKDTAKEYGVKVPRGADKDAIIDAILEQAGEDDDEDDDTPPI